MFGKDLDYFQIWLWGPCCQGTRQFAAQKSSTNNDNRFDCAGDLCQFEVVVQLAEQGNFITKRLKDFKGLRFAA